METKPIYLITEAPVDWQRRVVARNSEFVNESTHSRWENLTGVAIDDSEFTVMMPIHNEEKSLSSSVGALLLSVLPSEAEINTSFILNGCDDRSREILLGLFAVIGKPDVGEMGDEEFNVYGDSNLSKTYFEVKRGKNTFRIYETKTKGKANALKLGSNMACLRSHRILISVDANNYVEQDTVALMFKEAHRHMVDLADGTTVLSAIPKKVHRRSLGLLEKELREHGIFDDAKYVPVYGWCMALDAKWASGNIQPVAVEDYALGLIARSQGKGVALVTNAAVWGYRTDLKDSIRQFRRSVRGRLQLADLHPELKQLMESDNYFMLPFPTRFSTIIDHIKSEPRRIAKYIWRFVYGEFGIFLGKFDYYREAHNQSWGGLSSTK